MRTCAPCTSPSSSSSACMVSNTRMGKRWLAGIRSATGDEYLWAGKVLTTASIRTAPHNPHGELIPPAPGTVRPITAAADPLNDRTVCSRGSGLHLGWWTMGTASTLRRGVSHCSPCSWSWTLLAGPRLVYALAVAGWLWHRALRAARSDQLPCKQRRMAGRSAYSIVYCRSTLRQIRCWPAATACPGPMCCIGVSVAAVDTSLDLGHQSGGDAYCRYGHKQPLRMARISRSLLHQMEHWSEPPGGCVCTEQDSS